MSSKRSLQLQHGNANYELIMERLSENQAKLRGTLHHSSGETSELPEAVTTFNRNGYRLSFRIENRTHTTTALQTRDGIWVCHGDKTAFFSFVKRDSSSGSSQLVDTEIRAPMTGKIVDVRANPGDEVNAGQLLVVIEAMKMEFKLEAPMDAIVEVVECEPGQLVDLGQPLIQLKPQSETA